MTVIIWEIYELCIKFTVCSGVIKNSSLHVHVCEWVQNWNADLDISFLSAWVCNNDLFVLHSGGNDILFIGLSKGKYGIHVNKIMLATFVLGWSFHQLVKVNE